MPIRLREPDGPPHLGGTDVADVWDGSDLPEDRVAERSLRGMPMRGVTRLDHESAACRVFAKLR